jgi:hypothetical protein
MTTPLTIPEPTAFTRDRLRVLLVVLPLVAAACAAGSWVIASGPVAHGFDAWVFGGASALLLAVWGLLSRRLVS